MEINRNILALLLMGPFISSGPNLEANEPNIISERPQVKPVEVLAPEPISINNEVPKLIEALIQVESRGNDSAVGDRHLGEPSVGVLQLRPIMVREVNRILKKQKSKKRYKLEDRFSRQKSIEMFLIWKNYHHPEGGFETIARNWNGGPRGYKNKRTEHYWAKVQLELNKLDI
jgi:hypothetical protein